jgi:hypothetical protein
MVLCCSPHSWEYPWFEEGVSKVRLDTYSSMYLDATDEFDSADLISCHVIVTSSDSGSCILQQHH